MQIVCFHEAIMVMQKSLSPTSEINLEMSVVEVHLEGSRGNHHSDLRECGTLVECHAICISANNFHYAKEECVTDGSDLRDTSSGKHRHRLHRGNRDIRPSSRQATGARV